MKNRLTTNALNVLLLAMALFFSACEKDDENNPEDGDGTNNPTNNTFTDSRDGTVYKTVTIGDQVWMAENLKYLPSVVPGTEGATSESNPHYYVKFYNGTEVEEAKESSYYETYGVWYNWPAAMAGSESTEGNPSGVQGPCPAGWHLPSIAEWEELTNYMADNGYNYDGTTGGGGAKIGKALADSTGWPSMGGKVGVVGNDDFPEYQNKSGFTALPGGERNRDGYYSSLSGNFGAWWSATEEDENTAYKFYISYAFTRAEKSSDTKDVAANIRCVKN